MNTFSPTDIAGMIVHDPTLSERDKKELLIDVYNTAEGMKPFNFWPRYLDKEEMLKENAI